MGTRRLSLTRPNLAPDGRCRVVRSGPPTSSRKCDSSAVVEVCAPARAPPARRLNPWTHRHCRNRRVPASPSGRSLVSVPSPQRSHGPGTAWRKRKRRASRAKRRTRQAPGGDHRDQRSGAAAGVKSAVAAGALRAQHGSGSDPSGGTSEQGGTFEQTAPPMTTASDAVGRGRRLRPGAHRVRVRDLLGVPYLVEEGRRTGLLTAGPKPG